MIDVADSNTDYYYHFDGLGSAVALSNENKEIVERYSYDVFGEPNTIGSFGNPYLFTGRRFDNETGLYYYRARYYDYYLGRFLQTDPLGYDDGLNLYTYTGNNPISFIDPRGLCKGDWSSIWNSLRGFGAASWDTVYNIGESWYTFWHGVGYDPVGAKDRLGNWTIDTLEGIYDFETEVYNTLYQIGYDPRTFYDAWYDVGFRSDEILANVKRSVSQSDLLSSDPYTAGYAWGSLTTKVELTLGVAKVASSAPKTRWFRKNILSVARTRQGGRVITVGGKFKYVGKHRALAGEVQHTRQIMWGQKALKKW